MPAFLLAGCFAGGAEPATAAGDARLRVALAFPPTRGMSPHGDDAVRLSQLGVIEGLTRPPSPPVGVARTTGRGRSRCARPRSRTGRVSEAGAAGDSATRQGAIMRAEAAVIATDAAVPLLHERVVQGAAAGVTGVLPDARERTLVAAGTHRG